MYTKKTITLTSAQILALNSTPVEVLPAATGFAYIVKQVLSTWNSGTTQYATNTDMILKVGSSGDTISTVDLSALPAADGIIEMDMPVGYTADEGEALTLTEATGDPATGDISIDVTVIYEMVQG